MFDKRSGVFLQRRRLAGHALALSTTMLIAVIAAFEMPLGMTGTVRHGSNCQHSLRLTVFEIPNQPCTSDSHETYSLGLVDDAPSEHAALHGAGVHILVAEQQFEVGDASVGALDALEKGQELSVV